MRHIEEGSWTNKFRRAIGQVGSWLLRNRFSCFESWQAPATTKHSLLGDIPLSSKQWSLKKRLAQLVELVEFMLFRNEY